MLAKYKSSKDLLLLLILLKFINYLLYFYLEQKLNIMYLLYFEIIFVAHYLNRFSYNHL